MEFIENMVKEVGRNAAANIKAKAGDFIGDDDMLNCGNCQTPKQKRITLFGREEIVPCLCSCEVEKDKREKEEQRRRIHFEQIKKLKTTAFPESKMDEYTFENADNHAKNLMEVLKRYVSNFSTFKDNGTGLILYGSVGTGKTFSAACIANALLSENIPVLMTNFTRIANTVSGMWDGRQEYYDNLNRYPLLILDDLSAERNSSYMKEIVFNVIDSRYRAKLPMIITTNITGEEMKNPTNEADERIFSRILERCLPINVCGKDRRVAKARETIQTTRNILGLKGDVQ